MPAIRKSPKFEDWQLSLPFNAHMRVVSRIRQLELGNFGDCRPVGEGVSECRIHIGPGFRLYFTQVGGATYLLLAGGNKATQQRDIRSAKAMARQLKGCAS